MLCTSCLFICLLLWPLQHLHPLCFLGLGLPTNPKYLLQPPKIHLPVSHHNIIPLSQPPPLRKVIEPLLMNHALIEGFRDVAAVITVEDKVRDNVAGVVLHAGLGCG
jgi:hypothetical protein